MEFCLCVDPCFDRRALHLRQQYPVRTSLISGSGLIDDSRGDVIFLCATMGAF